MDAARRRAVLLKAAMAAEAQETRATRAAIADRIMAELGAKKAAWEEAKQQRLDALRELQTRALSMVGSAQKEAVKDMQTRAVVLSRCADAWEEVASTAVNRGRLALIHKRTRAHASGPALQSSRALYRRHVTDAAAALLRESIATAGPRSSRDTSPSPRATARERAARASKLPRNSPFYGPRASDAFESSTAQDGTQSVVCLTRVAEHGPPNATSTVRTPTVILRRSLTPTGMSASARELAARTSQVIANAREAAGARAAAHRAAAVQRGSDAAQQLRRSREGVFLLSEMSRVQGVGAGMSAPPVAMPAASTRERRAVMQAMPASVARDAWGVDRLDVTSFPAGRLPPGSSIAGDAAAEYVPPRSTASTPARAPARWAAAFPRSEPLGDAERERRMAADFAAALIASDAASDTAL